MLGSVTRLGSWKVFYVITYALFLDYFIYGLVVPLTAYSPANISGHEQLALLYGGYALGVFVATPVFGFLGNVVGGKRIVILGVLLSGTATLLFWFGGTFSLAFLARFCQGAASAATWTAGLALIAEGYVKNRVQMMGLALAGSTAGSVLGPVIGGVLYQAGGLALPFLIVTILVGIDAAQRVFLLPGKVVHRGSNAELFALLLDKSVLVPGLAVALAAFGWGIVEPLLPEHLSRSEATPSTIGIVFTISTIAFGLITPVVSHVATRVPIKMVIGGGTLAMAITLPLLGLLPGIVLTGFGLCLVSMSFAFMLNPTSAELGNAVDRRGLSCYTAVYAVYNIAYSVGMMASNTVATAAGHLQFYQTLLCVSAVLILSLPLLVMGTSAATSDSLANRKSEKEAKTI
ncbi:MAG TPA: MFS transporter [Chthoniobacterales bacterium]|jgi:MFS transporter, DHA1 family, solute carrier family 18 (vesicular amine transporter), member 1/2